ncbi:hypothetical protein GCM10009860_01570 [Microbacterium mitrae]
MNTRQCEIDERRQYIVGDWNQADGPSIDSNAQRRENVSQVHPSNMPQLPHNEPHVAA